MQACASELWGEHARSYSNKIQPQHDVLKGEPITTITHFLCSVSCQSSWTAINLKKKKKILSETCRNSETYYKGIRSAPPMSLHHSCCCLLTHKEWVISLLRIDSGQVRKEDLTASSFIRVSLTNLLFSGPVWTHALTSRQALPHSGPISPSFFSVPHSTPLC